MNDDELRQAVRSLDGYTQQLDRLTQQARMIQSTMQEADRASRSLEALAQAKPGDEVLLPVGASSFVNVIVGEKTRAIMGIGNDISVEKELPDAKAFVDDEYSQLKEALQKAIDAISEVRMYSERVQAAVEAEYRKRGEAQRAGTQ